MSLPSSELYARVLSNASSAEGLPTIQDETQVRIPLFTSNTELNRAQDLLAKCLNDLRALHSRIMELSIFSPNETVDDISTRDLVYLTVPYVFAEIQNRTRTPQRQDRLKSLIQVQVRSLFEIPMFDLN
jgi:hypothetical protein